MHRLDDLIPVTSLDLDPLNPRLPEEVQGGTQAEILMYLWENDVLDELIDSYLSNGYFESEPLITLPPEGSRRTVVEGNRRLAALIILHQLPPAIEAGIDVPGDAASTPSELDALGLSALPVVEADDAEDVASFLGFRHISGMKKWNAEAKARWLFQQVERRHGDQSDRGVFYDVGRQVGSNARGVRSSYIAYGLLRFAREELGLDRRTVQFVSQERFGVWLRLLGTANVLSYIGLSGRPTLNYEEVCDQINAADANKLFEVLNDLVPSGSSSRPILADSRDVTDYSDVLAHEPARVAMREFGSLSFAVEIARQGELGPRLEHLTRTVELLTLDVKRYLVGPDEIRVAEALSASTRALVGAVKAAMPEDEE